MGGNSRFFNGRGQIDFFTVEPKVLKFNSTIPKLRERYPFTRRLTAKY